MTVEELALLDFLSQIDSGALEVIYYPTLSERLIAELLAERAEGHFRLTPAGSDRLQSLRHLLAGDLEARRFVEAIMSQLIDS